MKRIVLLIVVFFISLANVSIAQLHKANKYYTNLQYAEAIVIYEKIVKKNPSVEVLEKLAQSYLKVENYTLAEKYYSELIQKENIQPISYFYYGLALKNNNKVDEAKEQFRLYSTKVPDDKLAHITIKSCDDIKIWQTLAKEFEVKSLENINSIYSDLCPVFYRNQLVFVSERTPDMVNYQSASNKHSYLNVYFTPSIKDSIVFSKKVSAFSSSVNTSFHDGPVCFNSEYNVMYLTRVDNAFYSFDSASVNRPQLFIATLKKGDQWNEAKPFKYNNPKYSLAHPSISADGNRLYFSSNMPGGKGGMDIYVCEKMGDEWGVPQNLGDEVNTPLNEVFPYIRKDDVLYFSSNGHSGFGGLDIFFAELSNKNNIHVKNIGTPINSYTDDLGIIFSKSNSKGYFSSDRKGGKGGDDIYYFESVNKLIAVQGKILYNKNINEPVRNTEILLLTEDGKVIKVSTTDDNGFFKFENLDPELKYMVRLDEEDPRYTGKKKFYMANGNDSLIRVTVFDAKGNKFTFRNLPADDNQLSQLGENDDVSIAGNLLFGENPSKPLEKTKVNLVNDRGEIVQTTVTNAFGAFVFAHLPNDENFTVRIDETDGSLAPGTKIIITNKDGKQLQTGQVGADGKFKFSLLANDKSGLATMIVDDVELRFSFQGKLVSEKKVPYSNSVVNLINNNGDILQSTQTNSDGELKFSEIEYAQDILISIDENDSLFKTFEQLFFMDERGNIIRAFTKINGKLRFALLPYEKSRIGNVYVEDKWLKINPAIDKSNAVVLVQGRVLLNRNTNEPAKNVVAQLLSETGEIIKVATTDANGFFKFENLNPDNKYMVRLDENDPQLKNKNKLYLTNVKGEVVSATVSDGKNGKFLFKNLPADENQLPLLPIDDDISIAGNLLYAENPSLPLVNTKIKLVNLKGEVVQTTITNAFGAFVFTHLSSDKNFTVMVDETDGNLAPGTKIIITNKSGKYIQTSQIGKDGKFKFVLLTNDDTGLSLMTVDDVQLRFDFQGKLVSEKDVAYGNAAVNLINNNGDVLQSVQTNDKGELKFLDIDYSQDILISIDENDSLFKTFQQLFFKDTRGNVIRAFSRINGKLRFALLPEEKFKLGYVHVDDPWLKVISLKAEAKNDTITIEEKIYYDFDKYEILPEAKMVLDKIVNIMKNDNQLYVELYSHTDSRSTLEYNMNLSNKRASTAVAYIVSKGISKNRISGKGFGESELLNKCLDDIECSDDEHAQNRRTEFYVKRK